MLLDFLPVILFFVTFKVAEGNAPSVAAWATDHLGFLVASGVVDQSTAPVLLATLVVMAVTLLQVALMAARRRAIPPMLWVSLALIVVMGGATVWFQSETFIKWKPTLLYWAMAAALVLGRLIWNRNFIRSLLASQLSLPDPIWAHLNSAWSLFFAGMGALNLWVAYSFETAVWVNFKLFGGLGLLMAFSVAQALYVSRHIQEPDSEEEAPANPDGKEPT